jgi:hypothetical protein
MRSRLALFLALLTLSAAAGAQQIVNCAPATPCTLSGPSNTGTGDPAWLAFGKINTNALASPFSRLSSGTNNAAAMVVGAGATLSASGGGTVTANAYSGLLPVGNGGTGAATLTGVLKGNGTSAFTAALASDVYGLWSGTCSSSTFLRGDGSCQTPGGGGNVSTSGSPATGNLTKFASATTITNGDLSGDCTTSGALAITCTKTSGVAFGTFATSNAATPLAIGGTTPAAGAFTTLSATGNLTTNVTGSTQCLHANSSGVVSGTGSDCGAGGGGGAFSAITSGTNTTAAMVVGTGASLSVTGTGTISATNTTGVNGAGVPVSALVVGSNGSSQLIATQIANQTVLGNGSGSSGAPVALTVAGNLLATSTQLITSQAINAQTGTSYAMATGDAGKLVTFNNASPVAVTLSQATTAGFTAGYSFDVHNIGAGVVTITPTTSTINGAATLTFVQNTDCTITSDGTNYQVSACSAATPALNNSVVISDSPASGPTNDYSPTGYGKTTAVLYLTPASGGTTLNGLVAGYNLQPVFIVNAEAAGGADQIKLVNQSASDTTATNRFLTSATTSLGIPAGGRVLCLYLGGSVARWQCQ